MSDNLTVPGVGTVATEDRGGVHHQRAVISGNQNLTRGAATVTTSAAQVMAATGAIRQRAIQNRSTDTSVFIGPSGVTTADGWEILPGERFFFQWNGAVFAIRGAGNDVDIRYWQES